MSATSRKLQVFVSSTYTDLKNERQAVVQAILKAGHIPAGMELFSAGSESQLETIYRWIDDCDVYLLILGGRYGTIEPKSGKSYTELEYEYALRAGKKYFSIVIKEEALDVKVSQQGKQVLELVNPLKLNDFREKVLGKTSDFFADESELKLAVTQSLNEVSRDGSLIGWIKADATVNRESLVHLDYLHAENANLRAEIDSLRGTAREAITDFSLPELPRFDSEVSIRLCLSGTPTRKAVKVLGTWKSFFPIFHSSLKYSTNDWAEQIYFSIEIAESARAFARELMFIIQGFAEPDVELRDDDFNRLLGYYIECSFLRSDGLDEPFTDLGSKAARRIRLEVAEFEKAFKLIEGVLPFHDEIPF